MQGIRPYFALKCNAALPVLATLAERGAGFEIASVYELDPLEAVGVRARDVLFSNTVKPEQHIRRGRRPRGVALRDRLRGRAPQARQGGPRLGGVRAARRRGLPQPVPAVTQVRHVGRRGRPALAHGTRVRAPPVWLDVPRRLPVHRPVDVLAGDRAMWPGDAAPRAVRDPHRDAEHRRRDAGDLRAIRCPTSAPLATP